VLRYVEKITTYLFLREIGNVTGHGGSDDQGTSATLLEVIANSSCAVEDTSQVSVDDLLPVLNGAVKDTVVGSAASVGDHDIDLAEVCDNVLDQLSDIVVVTNVALVGLALDTVLLGDLFGILLTTLRTGSVGDGDVGTKLGAATSGFSANASST
jgi:hypothetical protein